MPQTRSLLVALARLDSDLGHYVQSSASALLTPRADACSPNVIASQDTSSSNCIDLALWWIVEAEVHWVMMGATIRSGFV